MKNNNDTEFVRYIQNETKLLKLFGENQLIAIAFIAQWCPPSKNLKSQLLMTTDKYKNYILAIVDVDDPDIESLNKKFQTNCIPAVFLCHNSLENRVFNFIGCNFQKLNELIKKSYQIKKIPMRALKLKSKQFKCNEGHNLQLTSQLGHPYPANTYQCDQCKNVDIASNVKPMMHCQICSFDICHNCSHE